MIKLYRVTDCDFNKIWYDTIIGCLFAEPPGYARVKIVWIDSELSINSYND